MKSCGECNLCCQLLPVSEIDKLAGDPCAHQCAGGCAIYNTRPSSCRAWSCQWLLEDDIERLYGMQRPDRSHYVIDMLPDAIKVTDNDTGKAVQMSVLQVWVDPAYPDAHRDKALRDVLEDNQLPAIIRYNAREGFVLFPPSSPIGRGEWREMGHNTATEPEDPVAHIRAAVELFQRTASN